MSDDVKRYWVHCFGKFWLLPEECTCIVTVADLQARLVEAEARINELLADDGLVT